MASDGSNNSLPPEGPEALGDLRRRNGASATILKPDLLAKLRGRLREPPPDGGLWSSRKVADWMAAQLGLLSVAPQRGWEALKAIGWSIQKPRPKNPKSASPEEAAKLSDALAEEAAKHPGKKIEVFAADEHRIGLKPVTRRVWAPIGERPIAHGHHRFDWLYVTAFASPATGETFWYLSNGVSKEFFEALLETFAREAEAGLGRIILLVLDNAGWHGPANLKIPDGIRLVHLPPYSPELQPAETLWALVDEPIVNKHIATITELDAKIAQQCVTLAERPEQTRTNLRCPRCSSSRSSSSSTRLLSSGESGPPCGVPSTLGLTSPLSITPAFRNVRMSFNSRLSSTRLAIWPISLS
jgi:transposase